MFIKTMTFIYILIKMINIGEMMGILKKFRIENIQVLENPAIRRNKSIYAK